MYKHNSTQVGHVVYASLDILLAVHLNIIYFFYFQLDTLFFHLRTISAIPFPLHVSGLTGPSSGGLNCTCSLWYSPPLQTSLSCSRWERVWVLSQRPQDKDVCRGGEYHRLHVQFRLERTFSTAARQRHLQKRENTIGCMYNLDLLMMGLWGLKHVEEKQMLYVDEKQCIKSEIKKIKLTLFVSLQKACHCDFPLHSDF